MVYNSLTYEIDDGVLTVTLNRPQKYNAFTVEMCNELIDAFGRASADDDIHAVILTGAGKTFCVGMDLSVSGNVFGLDTSRAPTLTDLMERYDDPDVVNGVRDTGGRVSLAIYNCTKPVIAAINGIGVGVGTTMTLAADIRLMAEEAKLGFVFGKIGISPEGCSTWFLPRIVGIQQALEWAYSGDLIGAEEALETRLVKAVYPAAKLLDEARALARKFTQNRSPVATALTRQMMYRNSGYASPDEAHRVETLAAFYLSQGDAPEGVAAFLEKRSPQFTKQVSKDMPAFYPWW